MLLICYQRTESLMTILRTAELAKVGRIYVSIDGPKRGDSRGLEIQGEIRQILENFKTDFEGKLFIFFRGENRGCAASVISSCEWVFSKEESLFVLEDDCIPSIEFFQFGEAHFNTLVMEDKLMMICGSQFAPISLTRGAAVYSKYPLVWGWFTTKNKWSVMRQAFIQKAPDGKSISSISMAERRYWRAGAKRALQGRVVVWDTALASYLIENSLQTILPPIPLVSNIGNDEFATHTKESNQFLNVEIGVLKKSGFSLAQNPYVDLWMKDNFYKIATRHLFSTRITQILDFCKIKAYEPLAVRFEKGIKDFSN